MSEYKFNIAGLSFRVMANRTEPIKWLKERYHLYSTDRIPEVKVNLYYNKANPDLLKNRLFIKQHSYNIFVDFDKETFKFKVYTKKNYIGIASLLRFLTAIILVRKGGFLLHSCGVIINGGAYLLAGPSGVGKTTLARLIPNRYTLLSDETIAITKNSKEYLAWATPFFGDLGNITSNEKAVLRGILFLKQSNRFRHKQLTTAFAIARLLENILVFKNDLEYNLDNLFSLAIDVIKNIPSYELEFLPKKLIWKYIEKKISLGAQ